MKHSQSAMDYMTAHHTLHARQFARLLDSLKAIPDGDGTLLDHTLVVWHNELATGEHLLHNIPVVLAGLGSVLQTGTYLRFADTFEVQGRLGAEQVGTPHNKLLTALGTAMGLQMDGHCGVSGVYGIDGSWVDCTGTLAGVLR